MISKIRGRCGFSRTGTAGRAPEAAPTGKTWPDLSEAIPRIY